MRGECWIIIAENGDHFQELQLLDLYVDRFHSPDSLTIVPANSTILTEGHHHKSTL